MKGSKCESINILFWWREENSYEKTFTFWTVCVWWEEKSCCQPDLEKILYSWMFRFVFAFYSQILWAKKYFSLVSVLLRMSKSWKHWARLSLKLSFRLNRAVAGIEFCATFKAFQLNVRKLACLLACCNQLLIISAISSYLRRKLLRHIFSLTLCSFENIITFQVKASKPSKT